MAIVALAAGEPERAVKLLEAAVAADSPEKVSLRQAIQWIDENLPDDDSLVRLLEIPDQQLPILWLEDGAESRFRILWEEARRNEEGFRAEPLYSEEELRGQLQSAAPIRGLNVP